VTIAIDYSAPAPVLASAQCSVGRWLSHDGWQGWQEPCAEPGETCVYPPYALCRSHDADLAARIEAQHL
jgi:hypothetical protein